MLNDWIKSYQEMKQDSSKSMKFPTSIQYKKAYPFLKKVDALALANTQRNLNKTYKNFFRDRSVGFPKFKRKKNPIQSYTINN